LWRGDGKEGRVRESEQGGDLARLRKVCVRDGGKEGGREEGSVGLKHAMKKIKDKDKNKSELE